MRQPQGSYNQSAYALDEGETYFSHMLSPLRKNENRNTHYLKQQPPTSHKVEIAIKNGEFKKACCAGDIDCEAEAFIREKHRQLELSKTKSMISG